MERQKQSTTWTLLSPEYAGLLHYATTNGRLCLITHAYKSRHLIFLEVVRTTLHHWTCNTVAAAVAILQEQHSFSEIAIFMPCRPTTAVDDETWRAIKAVNRKLKIVAQYKRAFGCFANHRQECSGFIVCTKEEEEVDLTLKSWLSIFSPRICFELS